jgi:hypothetical protein
MGSGRLRAYLRVDEATGTIPTREARITAAESMGDINTLTDPFPATHQIVLKSTTVDATAKPWTLVADDRTFAFFPRPAATDNSTAVYFGEFFSFTANDNFGVALISRIQENSPLDLSNHEVFGAWENDNTLTGTNGHRLCRDGSGAVKNVIFSKVPALNLFYTSASVGPLYFPNPDDGSLILVPIFIWAMTAGNSSLRGRLRGVWASPQVAAAIATGDTVSGAGSIAGKSFVRAGYNFGGLYSWPFYLETSDTVERN